MTTTVFYKAIVAVYILQVSYVFDTEDVLHRVKRKKVSNQSRQDPAVASGSSIRQRRIQSYQKLLTGQ